MTKAFSVTLDFPSTTGDQARKALRREGVAYVKNAVPIKLVRDVREHIARVFARHGVLQPGTNEDLLVAADGLHLDRSSSLYRTIYDEAYKCTALHCLPHACGLKEFSESIYGEPAIAVPAHFLRISFPANGNMVTVTPSHQDFPANQGSERALTFWCPMDNYGIEEGVITLAEGRHREGEFPIGLSLRNAIELAPTFDEDERVSPVRAGDVLMFTAMTPHRALPNTSRRIRVSVDFRFQPIADPASDAFFEDYCPVVDAHWDSVYEDIPDLPKELVYYWRGAVKHLIRHDNKYLVDQVTVAMIEAKKGNLAALPILRNLLVGNGIPDEWRIEAKGLLMQLEAAGR